MTWHGGVRAMTWYGGVRAMTWYGGVRAMTWYGGVRAMKWRCVSSKVTRLCFEVQGVKGGM